MKKNLLSIDTNAKTVKGQKFGYTTGILYMAPHTIADPKVNLCPMSIIAECQKACLYSAGRGRFSNVQQARIEKAQLFITQQEAFINQLVIDIAKLVKKAANNGTIPLVRLNGTSDVLWERKSFTLTEKTASHVRRFQGLNLEPKDYTNIMEVFPDVQFYDYTKIAVRFSKDLPSNYDLTFSYSGVEKYQGQVMMAVEYGARIAVVFRDRNFPTEWKGMPVVDGDSSDIRHNDPKASIVALYAKGSAQYDKTGFVVDVTA